MSNTNTITRIHWDWGDGVSGDSWFPAKHTYLASGMYTVTATVYDSSAAIASKSVEVSIESAPTVAATTPTPSPTPTPTPAPTPTGPLELAVWFYLDDSEVVVLGAPPNASVKFVITDAAGARRFSGFEYSDYAGIARMPAKNYGGLALSQGWTVTAEFETSSSTLVVTDLAITSIDIDADSYSGTGTPGATFDALIRNCGEGHTVTLTGIGTVGDDGAYIAGAPFCDVVSGTIIELSTPASPYFRANATIAVATAP